MRLAGMRATDILRELDPETLLPTALGISPDISHVEMASGDTPIRYLNEAANSIARGEARIYLVAGGEAVRTSSRRKRASDRAVAPSGRPHRLGDPPSLRPYPSSGYLSALRERHPRRLGPGLIEGQAETGLIWSLMSKVAAESEGSWIKSAKTPQEIIEPSVDNRPITFPYNKLMVANSSVNQGAAFIVCSLATARAHGIPEERLVYVWAGASAHESEDPLERVAWNRAPDGMRVTLERVLQVNRIDASDLDYVELYSCFPCVPKMSRRLLGWPAEKPATVHGGLTFGGGPVGNYMSHAVAAMAQALRGEVATGFFMAMAATAPTTTPS